jgi:serine/threonine-protein kinase
VDDLDIAIDDATEDDTARGVRIGDYVLEDRIAEGGMGRVYRAHHVHAEHGRFAVKLLRGDVATTPEMRRRFLHEADTLRRLQHPNIVSVVDMGQTCGLLYMVMEYAPGISLAELIAHGPLQPARAAAIARQMCLGLEHMHDHGVIHRDFKPDNIIVAPTDDGDAVRIVDFGLAITDDPRAARITREGITVGTPSYIAPEQARGAALDGRVDLFALGMSLYEMLAGVLPFWGPPLEVVGLNATEDPPSIAERSGVAVPPALERVMRRLIARSPEDRFASASEVIAALDAPDLLAPAEEDVDAYEELEIQPARVPLLPLYPPSFVPVRQRRRGPTLRHGLAVLAAAAAVGVAVASSG